MPGLHRRAALGDLGADAVDVVVDVDAVGDGLLVGVLHDQVLVEEAEGLLVGRGGQADQIGVEVLQHLPPEVVDRAVALVGDDEVEGLERDGRVVDDRWRFLEEAGVVEKRFLLQLRRQLLAAQHRVEPLDGADADPRRAVEAAALQVVDDVLFGELVGGVG